jgi:hypothetical protein
MQWGEFFNSLNHDNFAWRRHRLNPFYEIGGHARSGDIRPWSKTAKSGNVGDPYRGPGGRFGRRHSPRWNEKAGSVGIR